MKYLLDTNVLCEIVRPQPNPKVRDWLVQNSVSSVVSAISMGEIWKGIESMPDGKRKVDYQDWFTHQEAEFQSRILTVDLPVMKQWGSYWAQQKKRGVSLSILDSLIASTAKVYQLVLVTRNYSDFPDVSVLNPWD